MINILFIHYGNETIRGSEICLLNLLKNIDRKIFRPYVLCNSEPLKKKVEEIAIDAQALHWPEITLDGKYSRIEILQFIQTLVFVTKLARQKRVNIIYSNSGLPTQIGYITSRILRVPIITHIHALHHKRYPWMWLFKFSDSVIFVSNFIKNDLIRKVIFKGNINVIYNGVDNKSRFRGLPQRGIVLREKLDIKPDEIVIGQVGEISYEKGCDVLIKAFSGLCEEIDNLKLLFIGEGKNRSEFIKCTNDVGLGHKVLFLGYVNEIEEYYKGVIDINVLASRNEALSLSLIEASSCCLPNVASNCGGISEVVEDGVSGLLFRTGDALDLKIKLKRLAIDQEIRKEMGINGRRISEERFGIIEYAQKIQEEILKVLGRV